MHAQMGYITNPQGERVSVILSLEDYQALLEEIADLTVLLQRQNEMPLDHKTVISTLKADGLL